MEDKDFKFIDNINSRPLMDCGHVALFQKKFENNGAIVEVPVCLRCGCYTVEKENVDLRDRKCRCSMCGKIVKSNLDLDGFRYRKNSVFDIYYCGCANATLGKIAINSNGIQVKVVK